MDDEKTTRYSNGGYMNERIIELVEQARNNEYGEFDKEKFAELIVRDCTDKIHQSMLNTDHSDLAYNAMLAAIKADIYESFGMQESKSDRFSRSLELAFKDGIDLRGQDTP